MPRDDDPTIEGPNDDLGSEPAAYSPDGMLRVPNGRGDVALVPRKRRDDQELDEALARAAAAPSRRGRASALDDAIAGAMGKVFMPSEAAALPDGMTPRDGEQVKPKLLGLDIRALRMAEARAALRDLKPLDAWKRGLTASQRDIVLSVFGNLDDGYSQMRAALEDIAAAPVPTTILLRWDGGVEIRWE